MAQPPRFVITISFEDEEASGVAGRSTVRTPALDALIASIQDTLDGLCDNLAVLQRDDLALADAIVEIHTLSTAVRDLMASNAFTIEGIWLTATPYAAGAMVIESSAAYLCMVAHTSGTFADDLAAGRWGLLTNSGSLASGTAFSPTATISAVQVQAAIEELDDDMRPHLQAVSHLLLGGI